MRRAIIGGTGVYNLEGDKTSRVVSTRYGDVEVDVLGAGETEIVFLARHGKGHAVPPHRINYRANMAALAELGVTHVYATCAVGSCHADFAPGDLVVLRDFMDFTRNRPLTFFEGDEGVRHADMSQPYCPVLRERFYAACMEQNVSIRGNAVYVCTEGPRFETASEIECFRRNGGDVVGMTNVPEVVLAKELGLCYAAVGIVTNYCTGVQAGAPIGREEVLAALEENKDSVVRCYLRVLSDAMLDQNDCGCRHALLAL